MEEKSPSIKAVELTRSLFEAIYGNIGLLKFAIEELTPTNGTNGQDSKKWKIICSFYKTLGSSTPSRYQVDVNLNDNSITIKEISEGTQTKEQRYRYVPDDHVS